MARLSAQCTDKRVNLVCRDLFREIPNAFAMANACLLYTSIKIFLDGDEEYPTICGTGTEDYFCGAHNFDNCGHYQAYSNAYCCLLYTSIGIDSEKGVLYFDAEHSGTMGRNIVEELSLIHI